MTENIKEIKPFRQEPYVDDDAVLTVTGSEYVAMQNIVEMFRSALDASRTIFDRNLNEGNIKVRYIQQDGTEISQEEATEFLQKASEYLKKSEKTPSK